MKALKRNYGHRNTIFFLVFSIVYLQAIYSLSLGLSVIEAETFKMFFKSHYLILSLVLLSIYMILTMKKHSEKVLFVCLLMIAGKNFFLLSASFNKLILGLSFAYLIFAFYFYITWELETQKASHNPKFSKYDLEIESRFSIAAKLENLKGDLSLDALITNIDDESCFLLVTDSESKNKISQLDSQGKYRIVAIYEGVEFSQNAVLASTYERGIGLLLVKKKLDDRTLNWSDLYKVCLDRGLFS
jgi:hypothetical protein